MNFLKSLEVGNMRLFHLFQASAPLNGLKSKMALEWDKSLFTFNH